MSVGLLPPAHSSLSGPLPLCAALTHVLEGSAPDPYYRLSAPSVRVRSLCGLLMEFLASPCSGHGLCLSRNREQGANRPLRRIQGPETADSGIWFAHPEHANPAESSRGVMGELNRERDAGLKEQGGGSE
jgi:hypothetical protein